MEGTMDVTTPKGRAAARPHDAAYQGYQILHWSFVAAPTLFGLDKFFHVMTNWDQYLAPAIEKMLPISAHMFMLVVGVVEVIAGLIVAVKPRIGAWIVAAWLFGIIVNLLVARGFYDVALRDFGLMLAAVALARLSSVYSQPLGRAM
jgi:hypothetical protein